MAVPSLPHDAMPPQTEGFLSRTLSSSPCIRWIIPARIRSPSRNDLAFVGETSVHLREFISTGEPHLAEATCKLDLRDTILAANVISSKVETVPTLEQTLHQTVEDEKFTVNGRAVSEHEPPQVLVLSTASCELVFLYVHQAYDGPPRFVYAKRSLLAGLDLEQQLGIHLAKDQESRALAVAPNSGHFTICALRSIDQIKSEINSWRPNSSEGFRPWSEQRFVQVDGAILRMNFLHSPKDEPEKVILVLLVAKQGRTYLLLYRWDTRLSLKRMRPMRSSGQELPREDGVPLMLIPCTATASFLLVTETEFVLYNRVMHSEAKRTAYEFQDPGAFKGQRRVKLWTQWSRPRRHSGYREKSDEIILVREDGYMATYEINVQLDVKVTFASSPGNLGFSIDTAFCFLAAPLHISGGDILVAGGSVADGGVYHLLPTQVPRRIQIITNGAPFTDLLMLSPAASARGTTYTQHRSKLFSCCGGSDGHGSLAEIELGLQAESGWALEHPDVSSILRMWTLEAKERETLLLLANHGNVTSLVTLRLETTELEYADGATFPGIDLELPTLASATITNDILVQITTDSLNVISLGGHFAAKCHSFGGTEVICADILPSSCIGAAVHEQDGSFALSMCNIRTMDRNTANIIPASLVHVLSDRPTSISTTTFAGKTAVLVTTAQGGLELLLLSDHGTFRSELSLNLGDLDTGLSETSASSCCVLTKPGSRTSLVMCGLKSGHLICLELHEVDRQGEAIIASKLVHMTQLALTTITVIPDEYSRQGDTYATAFIVYESALERLSMQPNEAGAEFDRCRVLVRNQDKPSLSQERINAVSRVPDLRSNYGNEIKGLLIYVTSSDFLFASMVNQKRAVTRHIRVPGVPKRVVSSTFLNKLIIGVDPPQNPDVKQHAGLELNREHPNATVPRLFFAPLDDSLAGRISIDEKASVVVGDSKERISALAHYSPSDDTCHYEMTLAVLKSSSRLGSGALKMCSRIVSVSDKHVLRNTTAAIARNVMRLSGKNITALCPIGRSGLLIGSNNELLLHNLNVRTKKWETLTRHALPSPAKDIRVQGSMIYVATEKHSLLILRLHKDTLSMHGSDTRARIVNNVVPIDKHRTLLADKTNRGTMLTGVYEDPMSGTLQRSFEMTVPHTIECIEQDKRRSAGDGQDSFIASAIDGTLYSFSTLTRDQWLMCYFLQGLCDPLKKVLGKGKGLSQTLDIRPWLEQQKGKVPAALMGIDGDLLGAMLEPGAYHLRGLLEPQVKVEEGDADGLRSVSEEELKARLRALRGLAAQVMDGVDEDVVGSVVIWLRALLQD